MAKGIYTGIGSIRKVKKIYVGVNGVAHKVKQVYVGVNGTVKPIWTLATDGQQIFTSSGTFVVPDGVHKVDIFCVGGGGKAGKSRKGRYDVVYAGGGGGAGGYTTTMLGVELSSASYPVTVGASGGVSSFGTLCRAEPGGDGANYGNYSSSHGDPNARPVRAGGAGGIGGSGGGAAGFYFDEDEESGFQQPTPGASNGGTANNAITNTESVHCVMGGTGQGRTTRAFGEAAGTLYSPGSGGKSQSGVAAGMGAGVTGPNSGSGNSENTNIYTEKNDTYYETTTGYSGIVIVRWKADEQ